MEKNRLKNFVGVPIRGKSSDDKKRTLGYKSASVNLKLPGGQSSYKSNLSVKKSINPLFKIWAFRLSSVVLAIIIIVGSLFMIQSYLSLKHVLRGGAKSVAILQTTKLNPSQLKSEYAGRINILLLGRAGGNYYYSDQTDTIMLASIDPINHTVVLISIPSNLWVNVPNQGPMKLNSVWETGEFNYEKQKTPGSTDSNAIQAGYKEVDQAVDSILGVTVNYNMLVNYQAFQQAINSLDGIVLNVPTKLYDPTLAKENDNNPVLVQAGWRTLTGPQALNYVRSRRTTSYSAREQRQRSVLVAIEQKAQIMDVLSDPLKITTLFNSFANNITTDLNVNEAYKLYSLVKGINSSSITSVGLSGSPNNYVSTTTLDGQSVEVPTAGIFNYSAIQAYVSSQLKNPYIVKENAPILVVNATNQADLGQTEETVLQAYGYNVIGTVNSSKQYSQTKVVDLSNTKYPYTDHYLDQRFNTTAINQLPDKSIQTNGAAFVIILGNNETLNRQG